MIAQDCAGNSVDLDKIRLIGSPRIFDWLWPRESVDSTAESVKSRQIRIKAAMRLRP